MADMSIPRPPRKRDLGQQYRLHPVRRPRQAGARRKRWRFGGDRLQPRLQLAQGGARETRAHIAHIAQRAGGLVVHAQQQRAQRRARSLRIGIATHDEFLPVSAFQLDPIRRARRDIGGILALADHAFETQRAGGRQQLVCGHVKGLAEADGPASAVPIAFLLRGCECGAQGLAPLHKRQGPQILPIQERKVERVIHDAHRAARIEGVLQGLEVGYALAVRHDDLAVQPARPDTGPRHRLGDMGQAGGPVLAAARVQADVIAVDACQDAVPVELQLVEPLVARGRGLVHERRELRLEELGQDGLARLCRLARRVRGG